MYRPGGRFRRHGAGHLPSVRRQRLDVVLALFGGGTGRCADGSAFLDIPAQRAVPSACWRRGSAWAARQHGADVGDHARVVGDRQRMGASSARLDLVAAYFLHLGSRRPRTAHLVSTATHARASFQSSRRRWPLSPEHRLCRRPGAGVTALVLRDEPDVIAELQRRMPRPPRVE